MKKISLFLSLVILLCSVYSCSEHDQKPGNDAVSAAMAETVTEMIPGCMAEKYTMDIALDTSENTVSGDVTVNLKNNTDSALSEVCFRLFSASVSSGTVDKAVNSSTGKEYSLTVKDDASVIYVDLAEDEIEPDSTASLRLSFVSQVPELDSRFGYHADTKGKLYNLSFCFPQIAFLENGTWFEDAYDEQGEALHNAMSDYYVTFTAPADYVVLSSGKSVTTDGKTVIEAPNVREMAITACNFAEIKTEVIDGITYNLLKPEYDMATPEFLSDFYDVLLTVSVESVDMYSNLVGDYIYDELDIVPCLMEPMGGMEMPGLVQVGIPKLTEEITYDTLANCELSVNSTCHEVGHEWFYCAVGNNQGDEPWLDESFTSFLEYYYMYKTEDGEKAFNDLCVKYTGEEYYLFSRFEIDEDGSSKKYINMPIYDYRGDDYGIVYDNGAWFFRKLELTMGTDNFFKMLSDWYNANTNGIVEGVGFIQHLMKYSSDEAVKDIVNSFISEENLK